jgi:orotidine-5'-phosphate decarboxylase
MIEQIKTNRSYLCVGLDTDIDKLPVHLKDLPDAVVRFNKAIIDATKNYCVSYKINTAFYEARGSKGWAAMEETMSYIPDTHFKIADAKRADIGNTSSQYARAFFETMNFDAVTVAPYMGEDSIRPFLEYEGKWAIVLGLTSNKGAADFEMLKLAGNTGEHSELLEEYLYERVLKTVAPWGNTGNLMFVVGATQAAEFKNIRAILPEHFLLVPGVGFQGGSLEDISRNAMTGDGGLLVNASRAIIYAGAGENFDTEAAEIARQYQQEMSSYF